MRELCCKLLLTTIILSQLGCMDTKTQNTNSNTSDWKLIWSDEFTGEKLDDTKWNRQVEKAGRFNREWQRYTNSEDNAYVENGQLVIKAIHTAKKHGSNKYTSARLNTAGKFNFKFGKVSARIKLPGTLGIWPAFWMLGANIDENGGDTPWPFCGEVDILELYGSINPGVVEANVHFANKKGVHDQMGAKPFALKKGTFEDEFHVFDLEWNEKELIWYVDGERYTSYSIESEMFSAFRKEFFLLLNVAVGGNHAGRPNAKSVFPQSMYVDWVRVYQRAKK